MGLQDGFKAFDSKQVGTRHDKVPTLEEYHIDGFGVYGNIFRRNDIPRYALKDMNVRALQERWIKR